MKKFYKVKVEYKNSVFDSCWVYYTDGTWRVYSRIPKGAQSVISSIDPVVSVHDFLGDQYTRLVYKVLS